MTRLREPSCDYAPGARVDVREVDLARRCERAGRVVARDRLHGLQRAVRVREAAAAKAAAASPTR